MREIGQQMTVEEKLDNLKADIQELTQTLASSLARINDNLRKINRRLSKIENDSEQSGNTRRRQVNSDYHDWSEKP